MAKRGRPKGSTADRRSSVLNVRVTKREKAALLKAAAKAGLSLSAFAVVALLKAAKWKAPSVQTERLDGDNVGDIQHTVPNGTLGGVVSPSPQGIGPGHPLYPHHQTKP